MHNISDQKVNKNVNLQNHYQKIIVAISETIRIMAEIDKVTNKHGGWPEAFTKWIMDKSLLIDRNAALKPQDSPLQTYGCRHTNSKICSDNYMENVCAFAEADKICKKPPKSWAKQYEKLLKEDSL